MSYVIIGTGTVGRTLASFFSNARIEAPESPLKVPLAYDFEQIVW